MSLELLNYAVLFGLIIAAFLDAKNSKIPNWLIYAFFALFAVKAVWFPESVDLIWQIGAAVLVFVVGLGAFALGAFGAGAVKLLSVVVLFLPLENWLALCGILLAGAFVFTFFFMGIRSVFGSDESSWACMRKRIVPLSWPIGTMVALALFVL